MRARVKKCSNKSCLEIAPIFAKNSTKKDGLNNQCKVCVRNGYLKRYEANKDRVLANNKKYRQENVSLMTAIKAEWRRRNAERDRHNSQEWRRNNIERARELDRANASRRRAWKRGVESDGSTLGDLINLNPEPICYLCDREITSDIHIDHVVPLARGGSDTIDNKALTHPFCNMSKGAKIYTGMSSSQSVINTTKDIDITTTGDVTVNKEAQ